MSNVVVLGTQWGDEGKGKIVDALAQKKRFAAVVRYQGGNNAGHTVVVGEQKHAFHLLPSGILYPDKTCVIGSGVVLNPRVLCQELERLEAAVGEAHARLLISDKAHLIMPWHVLRDRIAGGRLGTTSRGIGPTYADSVDRRGIRWVDTRDKAQFAQRVVEELAWNQYLIEAMLDLHQLSREQRAELQVTESLAEEKVVGDYWRWIGEIREKPFVQSGDTTLFLSGLQDKGKGILFEGAQATLLDILHGTYPFVTSSHPTVGGVYIGAGFRPRDLHVLGVAKAYTTRVGAGPFPTELSDETGAQLRERGGEFGTTTGRPRRCGWLDLPILRYAAMVNGLDSLAVTKLDVLTGLDPLQMAVAYELAVRPAHDGDGKKMETFPVHAQDLGRARVVYESVPGWQEDITGATRFRDLPKAARSYVAQIEESTGLPVTMVSVGPGRHQLIQRS